jgi:hypothetical protein
MRLMDTSRWYSGVVGVGGAEPLADVQGPGVVLKGDVGVATRGHHRTDPHEADGHVALVLGVIGVGGAEPLADVQGPGVVLKGAAGVAARTQHVPHPGEADGHVA